MPVYSVKPNARFQARRRAGARYERTLFAVACTPVILIEAPSSADHGGRLSLENNHSHAEETSGASPPTSTHFMVVSTCPLVPGPSVFCTRMAPSVCTDIGPQAPRPCSRPLPPPGRTLAAGSHASVPGTGWPPSGPAQGCLVAADRPWTGKPSTAARPTTTQAPPRTGRGGGAGAGGRRPLALPRPGGPPVPCADGACLACANGPHASRPCSIRTARTPGPAGGQTAPTRPSGRASPSACLRRRSSNVSPEPGRSSGTPPPAGTTWPAPASPRHTSPLPSRCPACQQCRGAAHSCAWGSWTHALPSTACHGATRAAPPAASSRAPRHLRATAPALRAPRSAMPPCRGPSRQRRSSCSARLPPGKRLGPAERKHPGRGKR
jgi:hypothetical protein